jgi:hypothetical protein
VKEVITLQQKFVWEPRLCSEQEYKDKQSEERSMKEDKALQMLPTLSENIKTV